MIFLTNSLDIKNIVFSKQLFCAWFVCHYCSPSQLQALHPYATASKIIRLANLLQHNMY